MITINTTEDKFIFKINGIHKLWAFESEIKVFKKDIVRVFQSNEEFTFWIGWRMPGTSIPGVITAGTFYKKGKRNFWDVVNKKKTIIVELKDSYYNKLIIEVKDPLEAINLLNSK